MTQLLILMRHAKSSWTDPDLADHDRPLNKRGFRSAEALGIWLREADLLPDQVLCSSALRARQTYDGLAIGFPAPAVPSLYHADPKTMLNALMAATGQCVLMIGHNPGIALFAHKLLLDPPPHTRFDDYPTGATLVARFDISGWSNLTFNSGTSQDFVIPRELPNV